MQALSRSTTWSTERADLCWCFMAQGWITAVDGVTGAVRWKYRSPRPMVAAITATAGDVLFTGELTGDFLAFDARSGQSHRKAAHGPLFTE